MALRKGFIHRLEDYVTCYSKTFLTNSICVGAQIDHSISSHKITNFFTARNYYWKNGFEPNAKPYPDDITVRLRFLQLFFLFNKYLDDLLLDPVLPSWLFLVVLFTFHVALASFVFRLFKIPFVPNYCGFLVDMCRRLILW